MKLVEMIPELEPILGPTYDAIVYQEQVMQICQALAGYSMGQADNIRRAMSKKKQAVIDAERQNFVYGSEKENIKGCVVNGISEYAANKLYDSIVEFAKYAFNKSHAAAYAKVSYNTAFLKYYFPAEYYTALLQHTVFDKAAPLIGEAKSFGVNISAPDINQSEESFALIDDTILFGFSSIKGVKSAARAIVENRGNGYDSFGDFMLRGHEKKNVTEALIYAGAFDCFCSNRQALLTVLPQYMDNLKKLKDKTCRIDSIRAVLAYSEEMKKEPDELFKNDEAVNAFLKSRGYAPLGKFKKIPSALSYSKKIEDAQTAIDLIQYEISAIIIPFNTDENKRARLDKEKEVLGLYVSENPLDSYIIPKGSCLSDSLSEQSNIVVSGLVTNLVFRKQKRGDNAGATLAFFDLEDKRGIIPIKVFADTYEEFSTLISEGAAICISGKCYEDAYGGESVVDNDDDDSLDETSIKSVYYAVIAKKISALQLKRDEVLIQMDNILDYRRNYDKIIQYKSESGVPLLVMFANGIIREAEFLVSKDIGYDFKICS